MSHTPIFRLLLLTFALSAGTLAASTQEPAASLARRILDDPNLPVVLAKAESLLKTGFTAGSGYGEIWIRDLNTFIEMSLKVNDPQSIREALLTFFKFQGDDGNIPDGYIPKTQANVAYKYRRSALAPDLLAHKNTVETDQESSLVQAVRRYVAITKDTAFLDERVDGVSVRQRLAKALDYVGTHRFDEKHGLVWGATTTDWGDVQPEHEWGVELNEDSHRALDIYDNAMFLVAIDDYLSLVGDTAPEAARWRQMRDDLRANVRKHLWDADRRKFRPHIYLEGSPFPETFDEASVYYHGGTAVAIEAGLLTREEIADSLRQMKDNVRQAGASSIGLTLYPPYPQGTFKNPAMGPYSYQNGGDWCWFGGRMIRQLIRHGLVEEAYRELTPMTSRVLRHGDFYEWWSRDNQPRGSGQYRGSAGVLGIAIVELLAWAKEHQDSSAVLWRIGQTDGDNAEFALAPRGWGQYESDGFYVVGSSDPKKDWPYAHPGPSDAWAGARSHTFVVLFGLATAPTAGDCRLAVHLLDTHSSGPPTVRIEINGKSFERSLPAGAGDASVNGEPAKGARKTLEIAFPAETLKAGDNEILITSLRGSWMLYDSVELIASERLALIDVQSRTLIEQARPMRALEDRNGQMVHPVTVSVRHFGDETDAQVRLGDGQPVPLRLVKGSQQVKLAAPDVQSDTKQTVVVAVDGKTVASREVVLKPVKKLTVYITPHSHTDIGYTEIQTAIEARQVQNLVDGIAAAKRTADYPEGARFVWNVEVLWAADLYLRRLDDQQRADFLDAVAKGQVVLNGMYLNELTGLCRPEELVRLFKYSTELAAKTGVTIDSAMISDVPGYTWGTVTAMAQAGIRYFSVAPNYFDRIGTILREWENKPFYWVGPDGRSKVLVWIPFWGYAMSHRYGKMSARLVEDFSEGLEKRNYPFDIAYLRWAGHGDNAVPDPTICEFVRDWNARYAWPRFIICGTGEAFRAFEKRYGDQLPHVRGDWTPYWEDGAGSSALETAMNRASSDRLAQAETLFAMLRPAGYPRAAFEDAWNSVLLYSEHTWGAWCSVSEPERKETLEQWEIKRSYAETADRQSRDLLAASLANAGTVDSKAIDVFNTLSWPRTELVTVPPALSTAGDRVLDDKGVRIPSQRLTSGELVFLARNVPPFAWRRYRVTEGGAHVEGRTAAQGPTLDNSVVRLRVDETTGGIVELTAKGLDGNFADTHKGEALNDYLYLIGDDLKDLRRNDPVTIRTGENGPLVASLVIESPAPGCKKLTRELRVVAGLDYVEIINTVDKERLRAKSYHAKEGKESVNFAFPFAVPDGEMLLDIPLGVMRPEADQIPSACKNWFTVGRWADVSNADRGITWVTLDAPLLQVGGLTATLLNSQTDPSVWRASVEPTQTLYSWAMNNHWGTNYRAYQEGPTVFRFVLRPHRKRDTAEASRFATGFSQPLLVAPAAGESPTAKPLLTVEPADVLVTCLKPSDDGRALIVRLFGASDQVRSARLIWPGPQPTTISLSDVSERAGHPIRGHIEVPAHGLVTLRAEFTR
ncbi:MAG TPA: polysaccharide lyase family protein [Sedimentisphaerales bacterium]|nr:polysaccharide lyase family protein [Sedimentisphaerales bacterium]